MNFFYFFRGRLLAAVVLVLIAHLITGCMVLPTVSPSGQIGLRAVPIPIVIEVGQHPQQVHPQQVHQQVRQVRTYQLHRNRQGEVCVSNPLYTVCDEQGVRQFCSRDDVRCSW
jgi:hypothetical protein